MTLWLIVPRDPLIFRDGKPFTSAPGERAKSLTFPYPSTIAGAVRSIAGTDSTTGRFEKKLIPELLNMKIRGPVLVELNENGDIADWLYPAPADALLLSTKSKDEALCFSLAPIEIPEGSSSNINGLNLIGPRNVIKEKPLRDPPRFWRWKNYKKWLEDPHEGMVNQDDLGIKGLPQENRTHVSISPETQVASPGALFQTSGLEFIQVENNGKESISLSKASNLALAVETDANLQPGIGFLGGERRIARWQKISETFPTCPDEVKQKIIDQSCCRIILLTPAYFESGFLPKWIRNYQSVKAGIEGAAIPRFQTVSGWDYHEKKPKPTRRLVPAGSVFFLRLDGSKSDIQNFVEAIWMQSVSDQDQFRKDGYGLAVVGTWDGELRKIEVPS